MIAIVFALGFEAKNFKKNIKSSNVGYYILNVAGKRMADGIPDLIRKNNIQCIVLMGFAGGLNASLCIGDVILAKNYTSPQFLPYFESTPKSYRPVYLKTVDRVIETRAEKAHCLKQWGADCCDMESAHVWEVAQRLSIPMITVRSISDAWDFDMPIPGESLIDPHTSRPNTLWIIAQLLRHPKRLPGFLRMIKQASCAARCLAEVSAREIIPRVEKAIAQKTEVAIQR